MLHPEYGAVLRVHVKRSVGGLNPPLLKLSREIYQNMAVYIKQSPPREGVRGGWEDFNWDMVKNQPGGDRDHYLGTCFSPHVRTPFIVAFILRPAN